ncbi:MAG: hypothetical protein R6V18_10585, partial [Desulfuromonadaceae bacterium]
MTVTLSEEEWAIPVQSKAEACPLCCAPDSELFWCEPATRRRRGRQVARKNAREYRYCSVCDLV